MWSLEKRKVTRVTGEKKAKIRLFEKKPKKKTETNVPMRKNSNEKKKEQRMIVQ